MAALLDNLPVFQYQNRISIADGRQAVSNNQAGASLHQLVQSFLNQYFTACIDVACRLVQQQDSRIGHCRAGDVQ